MKINEPVTQIEEPLDDDALLISRTDLKGIITFCNEEFIAASGFSAKELEGKSHNIVRHPDMPPAAFEDLWNTIKQGSHWDGLVKNRCKNGNHYWVSAHVTPMVENGQITGYVSVRTKPTQQEIRQASELYASIHRGETSFPSTLRSKRFSLRDMLARRSTLYSLGGLLTAVELSMLLPLPSSLHTLFTVAGPTLTVLACLSFILFEKSEARHAQTIQRELSQKITYILTQTGKASVKLRNGVAELEQRNRALQARNEAQTSNIVETQAAIKSLAQQVMASARSAEEAAAVATASRDTAIKGSEIMHKTIGAMQAISTSSQNIADIVGLIDEIAFQTNLLALNASVEAAHAGDSGRGFAVVATEVRALSQRTTSAAQEIKQLIDTSAKEVESGRQLVEESDARLSEIVEAATSVNDLVTRIADQSQQQDLSINEVNIAMGDMEGMAHENAQFVEHTTSASEFLARQSHGLDELLGFFKVDEHKAGDKTRA
ncbi:MAG: methyl-accepting chemotaxis protein [bacterium]